MRSLTVFPKSNAAQREKIIGTVLGSSVILLFLIGWELLFQFKVVNRYLIECLLGYFNFRSFTFDQ